ncbi:hypothetical protein [Stenotrophomonas maltophilia]|uniref:hypothetical protein n=1 Tax=Stenotrophomonas maltophilia TaxID=40324 RepID=UPI0039F72AC7
MNVSICKRLLRARAIATPLLVAMLTAFDVSAAPACAFDLPIIDPQPVATHQPGTHWTYSAGAMHPPLTLQLQAVEPQQLALGIAGTSVRREWRGTYADVNPLRKGEKVLLRFPLSVGAQWQDTFEEPGEIRAPFGRYRYDYQERGSSRVVAIETIRTALGDVNAYRIERDAHWRKSKPHSDDMKGMRLAGDGVVEGLERSISWYAPSVGRVVLRRSITAHPGYAAYLSAENDSPNLIVTELIGFGQPGGCRVDASPTQARAPRDVLPLHYGPMFNDTWEFRLMRDRHVPAVAKDQ